LVSRAVLATDSSGRVASYSCSEEFSYFSDFTSGKIKIKLFSKYIIQTSRQSNESEVTKKAGVRRQKAGGAGVSIETLVLGKEPSL
jgi:hypothetical protein